MPEASAPTLLVVLPGASGRRPVLERLQGFARACLLVPSADQQRSGWARPLVGDDHWIEWSGTATDVEGAWSAVQDWLQQAASRSIDGIMSYDEFGVELCSVIGERLGVSCTPASTIAAFRDKRLFRERCRAAGLPAVRFARLAAEGDLEAVLASGSPSWRFPSVLKPGKGAGSWHVLKIQSPEELRRVFPGMCKALQEGIFPQEIKDAGFTLEAYFAGDEVDVDGFARNGKVEFCMVSDNRPAMEPYFLELGGIYPSQLPTPAVRALEQLTAEVVAAFPGIHGCFHFEAKIDPKTLATMPIEFNARCGGAECPASVEAVSGHYLPEVAARLALNLPAVPSCPKHPVVASTNIHVFERGTLRECSDEGVDAAGCKLVTSVLLGAGAVGQPHVPNNGSASCLGWMAAGGCTVHEAEQNLQRAVGQARIVVEPSTQDADVQ